MLLLNEFPQPASGIVGPDVKPPIEIGPFYPSSLRESMTRVRSLQRLVRLSLQGCTRATLKTDSFFPAADLDPVSVSGPFALHVLIVGASESYMDHCTATGNAISWESFSKSL